MLCEVLNIGWPRDLATENASSFYEGDDNNFISVFDSLKQMGTGGNNVVNVD
jgi:hypothetical protein